MKTLRPADLAREHGLSAQAVRNYERDGFLPPARRTPSGYRVYTPEHAAALRAYLALIPAYGYAASGQIMHALHQGQLGTALMVIDEGHRQLLQDRETLDAVRTAVNHLTADPGATPAQANPGTRSAATAQAGAGTRSAAPAQAAGPSTRSTGTRSIGELARQLRVTPATLRSWEQAGILAPARDPATGYRVFDASDVRDAELAHLLRRGDYLLDHIATVVQQIRTAGGTATLSRALDDWQQKLTAQGLAMLTAAAQLHAYLQLTATG